MNRCLTSQFLNKPLNIVQNKQNLLEPKYEVKLMRKGEQLRLLYETTFERSKLIQTNLTDPDVELSMNLTHQVWFVS